MPLGKPLYLRGSQPTRKPTSGLLGGALFVLAIVVVNYLVFFKSGPVETPSLDQRLAKPVEVLPEGKLEALVAQRSPQTMHPEAVETTLARGDTSAKALARIGVQPSASADALAALASEVNMRTLKAGQKFIAGVLPDGELAYLRFPLDRIRYLEIAPEDGVWNVTYKQIPTDKETVEVACMMSGTLFDSISRCGADVALVPIISDLLGGQVDFHSDVRKGDVIRMIVDRESLGGSFLRYGLVHGVIYEGKLGSGSAFPHQDDMGKVSYYDQSGNSVERLFLRSPLKYTRISSNYTNRRKHPILKNYTPHRAIDYAAPIGTPVHAIGDGKVIFAGKKGANGNLVVIQHQDGFQSYYAHLSKFAKGLKVGSEVSRRSFIGEVGSTGRSTGPHLHFAVAKNGSFVHPRNLLQVKVPCLDADILSDFSVSVAKATARLKSTLIRGDEATKSY